MKLELSRADSEMEKQYNDVIHGFTYSKGTWN